MRGDDFLERRIQHRLGQPIARRSDVAIEGVEEPERRVGRVIQTVDAAFREQVRNESVAHVMRERAQDESRFHLASGRESQPLEADHRVAAPVREPVIAGDDGTDLVAECVRPRRLLGSSRRRDDELIRRQHELRRESFASRGNGLRDEPQPAAPLGLQRIQRIEHVHRLGGFGGGHQRGSVPGRQ